MRFPTRQILLLGICFGIWTSMLVCGDYFLGSLGAVGNGVMIACACGFMFQMLNRWQGITWVERSRYAVAVLIFFGATFTFQQFALSQGLGLGQEVQRLNETAQGSPQYSSVQFSLQKQGWVRASGLVASQRDLDNLHAMVDKCWECGQIYWCVGIEKRGSMRALTKE